MRPCALTAPLVLIPKQVARNVWHVKWVDFPIPRVYLVNVVLLGNSVPVVWIRNAVRSAPLDLVKAMKDKRRAQNVVQVNSITLPVPWNVNPVLKTLITATKEEIRRALVAQSAGRLRPGVLNVLLVVRERTAMDVNLVKLVSTEEQKIQPMYA